jgi:hypothetical protein
MELRVIVNPVNGAGPARRLLSNLFYGCGYTFYRRGNELSADDQLIRDKLVQLLQESRAHLSALQAAFLLQHRAAPGRDCVLQSAAAVYTAQALLHAQRDLEAMEAAVLIDVPPEVGCINQGSPEARGRLEMLVALDGEALLALVTLRDAITRLADGGAAAAVMGSLLAASGFTALWSRRQALLLGDSQ